MSEAAQTIDVNLRRLTHDEALTPGEQAADLLNVSPAGLLDEMAAGRLSGLIVDGQVWVNGPALQLAVRDAALADATQGAELRAQVRSALRAYLADQPVRALWFEHRDEGAPLVCARRGKRFTHFGIEYHNVVITSTALALWARDNRDRFPEHASLPIGPVLEQALVRLPGVAPVRSVTPLARDEPQRKVTHAFRVDPRIWPLQVPELITRLVNNPPEDDEQ